MATTGDTSFVKLDDTEWCWAQHQAYSLIEKSKSLNGSVVRAPYDQVLSAFLCEKASLPRRRDGGLLYEGSDWSVMLVGKPKPPEKETVTTDSKATPEPVVTRVVFRVGDDEWEAAWDGSVLSVECGSLRLTIDWSEPHWALHARWLVEALSKWDRGESQ